MTVLFTSNRPLTRCENLRAVFEAYPGDKHFICINPYKPNPEVRSSKYSLRVSDEYIGASPGKCIHIGHGFPNGKTCGLDQPRPYFRRENSRLITYAIAPSENLVDMVARQCGVPADRVKPYGMPRTDAYVGKAKGDGGTPYADKRVYLFAPTYRTKEEGWLPAIDWNYIDGRLTDSEVMIVKPHMLTKHILHGRYRHITEVSSELPSTPYLIDCDVLITDYSTIMFDAHILRKPVVLFEKETGYLKTRGMEMDYPGAYASRYCQTEDDLVTLCRYAEGQGEADIKCLEFTAGSCDGHATERVVKLIEETI